MTRWLPYYLTVKARSLFTRRAFTMAFTPMTPQRRHLIWSVTRRAGGRIINDPHSADAVFFFHDKPESGAMRRPNPLAPGFNFFCSDMSKSRVEEVFANIFGYALAVQPERYIGKLVIKDGQGGVNDRKITSGPLQPEAGKTYERLIDAELQPGFVTRFHCPTVKGEVPLVYMKTRPKTQRLTNGKTHVALVATKDVFRTEDLDNISHFCSEMGLDWGSLDILRDKTDGRIYIVNVTKTDFGPPLALPLKDKLRSADILAAALKEAILEKPGLIKGHVFADNDTGLDAEDIPVRIGS